MGIDEKMSQSTGTKPMMNTMTPSVEMYGKTSPPCTALIMRSQSVVRSAFTSAMNACALKMSPKPLPIFAKMTEYSS